MKALVYKGPKDIALVDRPHPKIKDATDAIVRITRTTICGTDTGIIAGKVPDVPHGLVLGHEGVGVVEEIGAHVRQFKKGERVIVSCISSCGSCDYCKKLLPAHCRDGGWNLGRFIDGTQAEYVRVRHADLSLHAIPKGLSDDAAVLLSDILPTGHEIGVQYGGVKPGDTVVIVGAGPIGMSALITAQLYGPAAIVMVDLDQGRLDMAKKLGASHTIDSSKSDPVAEVLKLAPEGVDVAIEAAGVPATWDVCQKIVMPGGHIAVVGVHAKSVDFAVDKLWIRNVKVSTGLVNATTTPVLMKMLAAGAIDVSPMLTHHFPLGDMLKAYHAFANTAGEQSMKIIVECS